MKFKTIEINGVGRNGKFELLYNSTNNLLEILDRKEKTVKKIKVFYIVIHTDNEIAAEGFMGNNQHVYEKVKIQAWQ